MPDTQTIVFSKTVLLTDDQIKALPTAGITLVEDPGEGKIAFPISALILTDFSNNAYIADADGYMEFKVGGNPVLANLPNDSGAGLSILDSFLQSHQLWYLTPQQKYISALNTGWDSTYFKMNMPSTGELIMDIDNNGAGDLTGGDPANTLKITVNYIIIDL